MPNVDFYILEDASLLASLHYACRLVEKAHLAEETVYIQTNSLQEAERLDMLLWTFKEDSFIPHQIYDATGNSTAPIELGYQASQSSETSKTVLFNLSSEIPSFYNQFQRITEIVFSDPAMQQLARERFKQYRDQGCTINTYKIKANEL